MWTELLAQYGLFLLKTLTLVVAILVVFGGLLGLARRNKSGGQAEGQIEIRHLNDELRDLRDALQQELLSKDALKALHKAEKKRQKDQAQQERPRTFVLGFDGDVAASSVAALREEITAILQVAEAGKDEVLLLLESPGGMVHGYGLAASQLQRLRSAGLNLTVAVDKVAASGGYLMACVADKVLAAPFAVIGSIGVVAQLPNFNRLLTKHDIDYEQFTAGQYKRTVTLLGKNTDEGRQKFQQELEETHLLFKAFVHQYRPQLDLQRVATGEHWYGQQALDLHLIDCLQTSDDYLLAQAATRELYRLSFSQPKSLLERLGIGLLARLRARLHALGIGL